MSKLEIVRALNDSAPQLQIVESVKTLQQTVSLMHQDLKHLPESVASETADALKPLSTLRQDVNKALAAYDQVTAHQRQSLDALTQEMSSSATQAFEQKTLKLDMTIADLSRSLSGLKSSLSNMNQTAQQIASLPDELKIAINNMRTAAEELTEARPKWWKTAMMMILAGAAGALLASTGQAGLEQLLPPSEIQKNAKWAQVVWSKATPKDRELLNQILNRPAQ